jgi:hypothetical protein
VFLGAGYTVRWRRGDPVAQVLEGRQLDNHGTVGMLGMIPVPPSGWADLAEVRQVGHRWLPRHSSQHPARDPTVAPGSMADMR